MNPAIGYGTNCEATGADCATVLADVNCPGIPLSSCIDCSTAECFDITVSSDDALEGNIVSFPGISFDVQLVADNTFGWTGAPSVTFTSPTFEVKINPNCASGGITSGFTWDSNSLAALPLQTRYILDIPSADGVGLRP